MRTLAHIAGAALVLAAAAACQPSSRAEEAAGTASVSASASAPAGAISATTTGTAKSGISREAGMSDWSAGGCEAPQGYEGVNGLGAAELTAKLGKPASETSFTLGKGMNEFRIELQNLYPLPQNADLDVTEQSWLEGDCKLTVWSVGGKSVKAVTYPAAAEF